LLLVVCDESFAVQSFNAVAMFVVVEDEKFSEVASKGTPIYKRKPRVVEREEALSQAIRQQYF